MLDIENIKDRKPFGTNIKFETIDEYYKIAKKLFYRIGRKYGLSCSKKNLSNDSDLVTNMVTCLAWADSRHDPSKSSLKTWRYNQIVHCIQDFCRRGKLHPQCNIFLNDKHLESEKFLFDRLYYMDEVKEINEKENIKEYSKTLTKKQSKLVDDYYFQGKEMKELGEEQGITKQAISLRLQEALKKMRRVANAE